MRDHDDLPEHLINRYRRGQLSEKELAAFEMRMMEEPELFDAVQREDQLQQALRSHKPADGEQSKNVVRLPARLWIRQPLSIAASLLVGVSVLLWSSSLLREGQPDLSESGLAVNSVVTLMPTRSSQQSVTLTGGMHLLQIDVGIRLDEPSYVLSLVSESGNRHHELQAEADANGIVRMLTPAGLSGDYSLTVSRSDGSDVLENYQIRFE